VFYEQLKKACKSRKTSVTAVLKAINIGTANGTYWKNGSVPSSDIVVKLSEFLQVSTDFLLTGKDSLKDDEQECLTLYRRLSEIDKGKIIGYMQCLSDKSEPEYEAKGKAI